jgi:MFS family permease
MQADAASFSLMVGMGESYLPAFVLAMGLGDLAAALITTVPLLAGGILQMVSPSAVKRLGSHRRWVVLCAMLQASTFLPLVIAALVGRIHVALVFLIAAVYWGAGLGTGPAWNTWAETLVPSRIRARYFARRSRLAQAGVLVGFLIGGLALHLGAAWDHRLWAFALVFLVAACCRYTSAALLASQSEPCPPNGDHRHVALPEFFGRLRHGADGRLLIYLLCVQGAVQVAGPYFAPFMLSHLKFSYAQFVGVIAVSFVAKSLSAPLMGRIAHRCGARRLLWVGGVAIIPLSGMWLVSDNYGYLLLVNALAGAAWAGYELAFFLLFFESIAAEERTSLLTTYNMVHSAAAVAGTIVGSLMFAILGNGYIGYMGVFAASAVFRATTLLLLTRVPDGRRAAPAPSAEPPPTRTLAVRPSAGSIDTPILPSARAAGRKTLSLLWRNQRLD